MCVELFCDVPAEVTHGIRDIGDLKVCYNFNTYQLVKFLSFIPFNDDQLLVCDGECVPSL